MEMSKTRWKCTSCGNLVKLSSPFLHWSALYLRENSWKPNSPILKVFVKKTIQERWRKHHCFCSLGNYFNEILQSWPTVHSTPHLLFISDSKELQSTISEKGDESSSSHNVKRFHESKRQIQMKDVKLKTDISWINFFWLHKSIAWIRWFGKDWLEMQFCAILDRSAPPRKFNSIPSRSIRASQWLSMCASESAPPSPPLQSSI